MRAGSLQRNPDSEEVEAPLVESVIPHGGFLVAVVVDGAVPPLPAGRRERPVPSWPRWLTASPGCGSIAPRGVVEVAALRIPMPTAGCARAAGSAGAVVARSAGSAGAVVARSAGSAGAVVARSARVARSAGISGRVWRAMTARRSRRWSRSGAGRTGAHTQRRRAKSTGDRDPAEKLLQFHGPHLSARECGHVTPTHPTLDRVPMYSL